MGLFQKLLTNVVSCQWMPILFRVKVLSSFDISSVPHKKQKYSLGPHFLPAPWWQNQYHCEFTAILDYVKRLCLKRINNNNKIKQIRRGRNAMKAYQVTSISTPVEHVINHVGFTILYLVNAILHGLNQSSLSSQCWYWQALQREIYSKIGCG